ncbi:MAG: ATP-binding protein [Candidatus Kapaibacterium sp.]|jgi:hypothetical protein
MHKVSVSYKPSEVRSLLQHIVNNNQYLVENDLQPLAIEIVGEPGIGKTTLVIDEAKRLGLDYYKLSMSQTDELSDLVGFPIREFKTNTGEWISEKQLNSSHELSGEARTAWCPPKWVPNDENSKGVLILDDWTRADSRFAQATMELIEKSEYMSWKLPKGWSIVLTSNPDNGDYAVNSLDTAQKTRYLSINMKYDKDDWAEWAEANSIDSRCINFVLLNPEVLDVNKNLNARIVTKFFNSISSISSFKGNLRLIRTLGEASVGSDFVERFLVFINNEQDRIPSPHEILTHDNEEYIIGKIKQVSGDREDTSYKAAVAGTIAARLVNYIKYSVTEPKKFKKKAFTERIKNIMLAKLFHDDTNYYLTASFSVIPQFEAFLQDPHIKQFIR